MNLKVIKNTTKNGIIYKFQDNQSNTVAKAILSENRCHIHVDNMLSKMYIRSFADGTVNRIGAATVTSNTFQYISVSDYIKNGKRKIFAYCDGKKYTFTDIEKNKFYTIHQGIKLVSVISEINQKNHTCKIKVDKNAYVLAIYAMFIYLDQKFNLL